MAYGIGDHLLSVQYDPRAGTEPLGMHLVAGFEEGRLVQLFVIPFHNDARRGRLGPLEEAAFGQFVKTLRERSTSDQAKYYSDRNAFELMIRGLGNMSATDLWRLRPRHFVYGARLVLQQRTEWIVVPAILAVGLVALYRRRSRRHQRGERARSGRSAADEDQVKR